MTVDDIAAALKLKREQNAWRGPCPVHGGSSGRSFSLTHRDGKILWHCHGGCTGDDIADRLRELGLLDERVERPKYEPPPRRKTHKKPNPRPHITIPQHVLDYLANRGISRKTVERNRLDFGLECFAGSNEKHEALIFPHFRDGEVINRHYRAVDTKLFRLERDCEVMLYGVDDIEPERLVWVEGRLDKLSIEEAGITSCVSVPNGAPSPNTSRYESMLSWLDADRDKLEAVREHVIAVDADAPGERLTRELIRRIGPEKCSVVRWPEDSKDANDVLTKHGADDLRWLIDNAEPCPIEGTITADDLSRETDRLYVEGMKRGESTGWPRLDQFYTVRPCELTVITGTPGSGKSTFVDAMLVNLARLHGWRFALFAPESLPVEEHIAHIAEKLVRKPFTPGPTQRMTLDEFRAARGWIDDHFTWVLPSDESDWHLEKILAIAGQLCFRKGINGFVIDPWNELESTRSPHETETEWIGSSLKRIRSFARNRRVHFWVVAHPQKLLRGKDGKYPVPTLWDISGSANWRNRADNGIVVWRDMQAEDKPEVDIHVQKIRFRQVGRRGTQTLHYDRVTATYSDDLSGMRSVDPPWWDHEPAELPTQQEEIPWTDQ